MKKIILSAAIVCTCLGSAFAQTSSTPWAGGYSIAVADQIILTPSGSVGTVTATFNNPTDLQNGVGIPAAGFNVSATRSWKASHANTGFTRNPTSTNPAISNTAPASIMKIWMTGLTGGAVIVPGTAVASPGQSATVAPTNVVQSPTGSVSQNFTVNGMIIPGFALNLSGTYQSTTTIVASLD